MIRELGSVEFFELCEKIPKAQCNHCLLFGFQELSTALADSSWLTANPEESFHGEPLIVCCLCPRSVFIRTSLRRLPLLFHTLPALWGYCTLAIYPPPTSVLPLFLFSFLFFFIADLNAPEKKEMDRKPTVKAFVLPVFSFFLLVARGTPLRPPMGWSSWMVVGAHGWWR